MLVPNLTFCALPRSASLMSAMHLIQSCPNLGGFLPPPPPLLRSFRCDPKPLPSFLQESILDWMSSVPSEHIERMNDILRNIQFSQEMNLKVQGQLWFEIQHIFRRDLISQDDNYVDGRRVRLLLLKRLKNKTSHDILSPCMTPCSYKRELGLLTPMAPKVEKIEVMHCH